MELTKPQPTICQRMYALLRKNLNQPIARNMMALELGVGSDSIDDRYLRHLAAAGYVIKHQMPRGQSSKWQLIKDAGIDAPRFSANGSLIVATGANEAIWQAIRILKTFTREELAAHVAKFAKSETVASYIKAIEPAGYLKRSGAYLRPVYTLVRNTGPKPPQILRIKEVYDPNLDEIVLREVPDRE